MDNNTLENNFNGFEPQKPFTERAVPQASDEQPSKQTDEPILKKSQEPDKVPLEEPVPLQGQPEPPQFSANDSERAGFNPLLQQSYNGADNNYRQSFPNAGFQPAPERVDYSNRVNCNSQSPQQGYGFNQNVPQGNGFNPNPNPNPPIGSGIPYQTQFGGAMPYAPYPQPTQNKTNKGIIALIIVLSSLLVLGFGGLLVYIAVNNGSGADKNSHNSGDFGNRFDYTIPGYDFGKSDPTLPDMNNSQNKTYGESDYSNKINPDYSGIKLNDKPKDADKNSNYNAATASQKIADSVVGVVCYTDKVTTVEDCESQGSGIIITDDGYVVTNAHVVGNSKTAYLIQIVTSDGKAYNAGVVGFDSRTDLALLKMDDAKNLKAAVFGDSDEVQIGEDIIVVGNPGGLDYQNTTTKGVISAVNRGISSSSLVKYIQTDAAINPGNSGGPLVNVYGQVIGIATSKIVSETYEGMGFAIPSKTTKEIIDMLMKKGYVEGRVKIGISGLAVDSTTASAAGYPQGIQIQEIIEGGPCDNTKLRVEDIIIEADGTDIKSFTDIYEILENHKSGDRIEIKYYRPSTGKSGTVTVTLQEDK